MPRCLLHDDGGFHNAPGSQIPVFPGHPLSEKRLPGTFPTSRSPAEGREEKGQSIRQNVQKSRRNHFDLLYGQDLDDLSHDFFSPDGQELLLLLLPSPPQDFSLLFSAEPQDFSGDCSPEDAPASSD